MLRKDLTPQALKSANHNRWKQQRYQIKERWIGGKIIGFAVFRSKVYSYLTDDGFIRSW